MAHRLVAAAVLALVGATALGVSSLSDDDSGEPAAATNSGPDSSTDQPGIAGSESVGPTTTAEDPRGPLPPPDPGWRYASYRDVVVQVPESWAYEEAPGPDWCAYDQGPDEPPFPNKPYVAMPDRYRVVDVADVATVGAISICQYDRADGTRRPGLMGSRLLTGRAPLHELRALQAAPIGGGPDTPAQCVDDMYGDTAPVPFRRCHA